MKEKKTPERQCLGCGAKRPKGELIRIARSPGGEISIDLTGKKSGRGAYICRDARCLDKARKSRRIERCLGCAVKPETYAELECAISGESRE